MIKKIPLITLLIACLSQLAFTSCRSTPTPPPSPMLLPTVTVTGDSTVTFTPSPPPPVITVVTITPTLKAVAQNGPWCKTEPEEGYLLVTCKPYESEFTEYMPVHEDGIFTFQVRGDVGTYSYVVVVKRGQVVEEKTFFPTSVVIVDISTIGAYYTTDNVTIYSEKSTLAPIVVQSPKGNNFDILHEENGWMLLRRTVVGLDGPVTFAGWAQR